jgi:hypothetical protein
VSLIGNRNITEFNYRYNDREGGARLRRRAGRQPRRVAQAGRAAAQKHGYPTLDLTDDEMAKGHIRHMVGGHAPQVENELLYRFEFPERPGALMNFLNQMSAGWNISLFHYRNHGADYGRVLVGMQVPPARWGEFKEFLKNLGYAHWKEPLRPARRRQAARPDNYCFERGARKGSGRRTAGPTSGSAATSAGKTRNPAATSTPPSSSSPTTPCSSTTRRCSSSATASASSSTPPSPATRTNRAKSASTN